MFSKIKCTKNRSYAIIKQVIKKNFTTYNSPSGKNRPQVISTTIDDDSCSSKPTSLILNDSVQYEEETKVPPKNEPVYSYLAGSEEHKKLMEAIQIMEGSCLEVPIMIGDKEYRTNKCLKQYAPHNLKQSLAVFYLADEKLIENAIETAVVAQRQWDCTPFSERFKIWSKIVDLMQNKYRYILNAATMLGQSKTIIQAEIDSAAELIDFFTFNAYAMKNALTYQPLSPNPNESVNTMKMRGLEGFCAAITPFNFTAIAGNLAYTPVLAGCSVIWKPTSSAILSNYYIHKICREAGLPTGIVSFLPCDGPTFSKMITKSKYLSAINFTGSTTVFKHLWKAVSDNLSTYLNFPRLIGECGGKNYHFVYLDANVESVINGTIRSAFEYCGQKCSACSRMYVPDTLWPTVKEGLIARIKELKIGNPTDVSTFMSAVIDENAFNRIKSYIDYAKKQKHLTILVGGECDNSIGYFVKPTLIETTDPNDRLMNEEIFGPILTVYVYRDREVDSVLDLLKSSPYALTGAIYSRDVSFLKYMIEELKYTAGNLYINDKSTGSVVGQQPFGGSRMSGTNDKAGGPYYVLKFLNPVVIKETFIPLSTIYYPYMTK